MFEEVVLRFPPRSEAWINSGLRGFHEVRRVGAHAREPEVPLDETPMEQQDTVVEKLNDESIDGWIKERTGWTRMGSALLKDFSFDSFRAAIVFVNRVATLSDKHAHHPDIAIHYSRVRLSLTTHDVGGITEKDLNLAEQVDFATSVR